MAAKTTQSNPQKSKSRQAKTSAQKIEIQERRMAAVALRKQGGTYDQIATQLRTQPGVPATYRRETACRDVLAEMRRRQEEIDEDVDVIRRLELERIDDMFASIWPFAKQGDYQAIVTVLKLQDQRAKYYANLHTRAESNPRGAGGSSGPMIGESSGGQMVIREVIVQLTGVQPDESNTIDVTPTPVAALSEAASTETLSA